MNWDSLSAVLKTYGRAETSEYKLEGELSSKASVSRGGTRLSYPVRIEQEAAYRSYFSYGYDLERRQRHCQPSHSSIVTVRADTVIGATQATGRLIDDSQHQ